jgi:hypothetical protein
VSDEPRLHQIEWTRDGLVFWLGHCDTCGLTIRAGGAKPYTSFITVYSSKSGHWNLSEPPEILDFGWCEPVYNVAGV